MIVYLDQNKWIELARIINGKDKSPKAKELLNEVQAARQRDFIFPLSAIHIIEFSRIRDNARRSRLGQVMWRYSGGATTAPLKEILCKELEIAFSHKGYQVERKPLPYIGHGVAHAFGEKYDNPIEKIFSDEIDEAMFCGLDGLPPIQGAGSEHRKNFANHLRAIHENKRDLEPSKRENWLYAISMVDIIEPLYIVMSKYNIPNSDIEAWGEQGIKEFMDSIPTRSLDIHLHRQVLKNPEYKPKHSDLEDWAGLGPAMCYADIVVCEKHFADLVQRDNYQTNARVKTSIYDIFPHYKNAL